MDFLFRFASPAPRTGAVNAPFSLTLRLFFFFPYGLFTGSGDGLLHGG